MEGTNFNKLSKELILEYMKGLGHNELKSQCRTNRKFRRICKEYEDEIYTHLLLEDFGEWTLRPKLVYNALNTRHSFRKRDQHNILKSVIYANKKYELYVLLKEYKFNVETKIEDMTLLQYAVMRPILPVECINVLLDFNANIDEIMLGDSTPLSYLLSDDTGHVPDQLLIRMLEMNPQHRDVFLDTIFHIGFGNHALGAVVIEKLLSLDFDINEQDGLGNTPLHLLIQMNFDKLNKRMMERVMELSPDLNLINRQLKRTVLILAVMHYFENTHVLGSFILDVVQNNIHFDINKKSYTGYSAIMEALAFDEFPGNIIQKMLKRPELDVDDNTTLEKGRTLLMQCVSHKSANTLYDVIMSKNPLTNVTDRNADTAAMIAVRKKRLSHQNILKLVKRTDNLMQRNIYGTNLLELCLWKIESETINDICDYIFSKVTRLEVTKKTVNLAESNDFLNKANRILIEENAGITTSESG